MEDRAQRVPRAVRAYEQLRELVELATVDAAEQAPAVEPPRPAVEGRDADELAAIARDDRLELGVARVVARPDRQPAGIRERVPRAGCLVQRCPLGQQRVQLVGHVEDGHVHRLA